MAGVLKNVLVGDDYTSAATLQNLWTARGGSFRVANASIVYRLQYGHQGEGIWTPEAPLDPQVGGIEPGTTGVQFRNLTAGTIATVSVTIAEGKEPLLTGQQFTGTVTAGQVTLAPTVINGLTGIVSAAGAVLGGTGFSVNRTGVGVYVITFTTAFAAVPVILATALATGALANVGAPAATGCTVNVVNSSTLAAFDGQFDFLALAIQ